MTDEFDLVLRHEGDAWIASAPGLSVRAADFVTLDERLRRRLRREHGARGKTVRVCMRFDLDGLPGWTRQYAAHYFNRLVRLTL